jgi:chitin synthase
LDPNTLGDPYAIGRPESVHSNSTTGVESAWRRRQTIKRGVTRKVKLTQGNFIAEYPVPTPVHSAIDAKWSGTKTTEFSLASLHLIIFSMLNYGIQPYAVYCGDL